MAKLVVLAGPTAAGKSSVALLVAQKMGGEIICADSVQVYKGLDIGTDKPTIEDYSLVPHHLYDFVDPSDNYTVAQYQKDARNVISGIINRGKLPLLVGGTGLYIRAVLQGFAFLDNGPDMKLRNELIAEAETNGSEQLHHKLTALDAEAAANIHRNDLRRIVRALEFNLRFNKPFSTQAQMSGQDKIPYKTHVFGITMPRKLLYQRIEERVDNMVREGLVDEVRGLLQKGVSPEAKSMQSIGYRHVVGFLQGEVTLETTVNLLKRDTRRLAKRQLTWFRKEPGLIWIDIAAAVSLKSAAENICDLLAGD